MSTKYRLLLVLTVAIAQWIGPSEARYRGVLRPHDETETLKRVISFYKTQDRAPMPESVEAESKEAHSAPTYQTPYRIDLDDKDEDNNSDIDSTDSPIVFSLTSESSEDDLINHSAAVETVVVTTIGPNPEEAEDETTTLFPVTKMEEFGVSVNNPVAADEPQVITESTTKPKPEVVPTTTAAPPECSEGDLRRQACNTCICIGGRFLCSQRICPPGSEEDLKTGDRVDIAPTTESTTTTSTLPPTTVSTTPVPECHTGITKSVDCNMCVCAPNEKWACTKRSCIALTLREKASYSNGSFVNRTESLQENSNFDEDCNEGETRKTGCNICVCFMNSWSCTNQECPSTTPPPKVTNLEEYCQTEEDIKSIDCNVCHCKRGIWVCTTNDCKRFGGDYHRGSYLSSRNKFKLRSGSKTRGVVDQEMDMLG